MDLPEYLTEREELERKFPRRDVPYAVGPLDLVYPHVVAEAGEEAHVAVMGAIADANKMDILEAVLTDPPEQSDLWDGWVTYRVTLAPAYVGTPRMVLYFTIKEEGDDSQDS